MSAHARKLAHRAAPCNCLLRGRRLLYHKTMALDPALITGYHAHIYYDAQSRDAAAKLRQAIGEQFEGVVGRWHDESVGPHPVSMYQFAFAAGEFARIVPWLMLNRNGLRILVHPETGHGYSDHMINSLWLGQPVALNVDFFKG